ncbi:MAG: hypothetical protein J0H31_03855 [Alphaproteobacteria bacterium]|nr:hypothetical protein [Alphaproteobacteria bacterium]
MAEQGLAAEEHRYRASGIADMLEDVGFANYGSEGRSFQQALLVNGNP